MPSTDMFDRQKADYKASVLTRGVPRVAIEAGVTDFWYKYVGLEGAVVGIDTFGESAPAPVLFKHFGFTVENVVGKVKSVRLTENGVAATLSIDSGTKIPTNSAASVHSVSAVGEQYVEFTPPTGDSSSDYLADGATVSTTDVPVEISRSFGGGDLVVIDDEGHMEHLDPGSKCWRAVIEWL